MKIVILLALMTSAYANTNAESERLYKDSDRLTPAKKVLLKMKSYNFSEVNDLGIREYITNQNDQRSLSIAYNFSSDFKDFSSVSGVEVGFQTKSSSYSELWYSFFYKSLNAKYEAIADEVQASSTPEDSNANSLLTREGSDQKITQIGIGLGYKFAFFANSFNFTRVSEMITSHLSYVIANDSTDSEDYKGYGIVSEYLINYRMSNSLYTGLKLTYSILSMERSAIEEEKLTERSLVYGWLGLGLQFGFYF